MNKSLCKAYGQVGAVTAFLLVAIAASLLFKMAQRWSEIAIDEGGSAATLRRAWSEGLVRRADDPSLWALVASIISGFLVVRAATALVRTAPDVDLRWLLTMRGLSWWVIASGLSVAVYLGITRAKHEGYWYEIKPENARYLDTSIPFLQDVGAGIDIVSIVAAASLFLLAMRTLRLLKARTPPEPIDPGIGLRSCAAYLATLALFPVVLLVLVALYHQLVRVALGHPVTDALMDFLTGSFGALLICWPMVVVSWIAWSRMCAAISKWLVRACLCGQCATGRAS